MKYFVQQCSEIKMDILLWGHFKVIIVVTMKNKSILFLMQKKCTNNRFFSAVIVENNGWLEIVTLALSISMRSLVLHITAVVHLFCDWFALSTQILLPFSLMISKVYLADKGQECSMAWKSVKYSIPNGKFAPGLLNTNWGPGTNCPSDLHYDSFIHSANLPEHLPPLC